MRLRDSEKPSARNVTASHRPPIASCPRHSASGNLRCWLARPRAPRARVTVAVTMGTLDPRTRQAARRGKRRRRLIAWCSFCIHGVDLVGGSTGMARMRFSLVALRHRLSPVLPFRVQPSLGTRLQGQRGGADLRLQTSGLSRCNPAMGHSSHRWNVRFTLAFLISTSSACIDAFQREQSRTRASA